MKRSWPVLAFIGIAVLLAFCVWHFFLSRHDKAAQAQPLLSAEETVELVMKPVAGELPFAEIQDKGPRLNPAARTKLYDILADEQQKAHWQKALHAFEWIGQAQDVEKLSKFPHSLKGVLGNEDELLIQDAAFALGGMAHRGVPGAREALREMLEPDYWRGVAFSQRPEAEEWAHLETHMLMLVFPGYARSGCRDCPSVAEETLKRIQDPKQREILRQSFKGPMEMWKSYAKTSCCGVHGKKPASESSSPSARRKLPNQPPQAPVKESAQDESPASREAAEAVNKALSLYESLSAAWLAGRYEEIALHLADDGHPVVAKERLTDKKVQAVAEGLARLKAYGPDKKDKDVTRMVLKALKEAPCRYGPAEVAFSRTCSFSAWNAQAQKPEGVQCKATTLVKVTLLSSRSIAERHLRLDAPSSTFWRNNDGDLVVYVFKQDDQWYWNPFGW